MQTKQRKLRTEELTPNENISFPIGTMLAVKRYHEKLGLDGVFGKHKGKGHDINDLVRALLTYRLTENRSVTKAAEWTNRGSVLPLFNLETFDQQAFYRTLNVIGENHEEIMADIQDALFSQYTFEHTDVNLDWTSLVLHGEKCRLGKRGYSRDHRPDKRQITIGLSLLAEPVNVPIGMTVKAGNVNDQVHFKDTFGQIVDRLRPGSLVVMDQGASGKPNLDDIENAQMKFLTIRQINTSDETTWMRNFDTSKAELVDEKRRVYGLKRHFPSRINYCFFSEELKDNQIEAKLRKVERLFREAEELQAAIDRNRNLPKRYRINNPLVDCKYVYQTKLKDLTEDEARIILKEAAITGREGFFCLVSNKDFSLKTALAIYRKKDSIEKAIHTLKGEIDIRPLRVWSDESVYGALILGFIALLFLSLIKFDHAELRHTAPIFIKFGLMDLTLTVEIAKNGERRFVYSNFNPVSRVILAENTPFL